MHASRCTPRMRWGTRGLFSVHVEHHQHIYVEKGHTLTSLVGHRISRPTSQESIPQVHPTSPSHKSIPQVRHRPRGNHHHHPNAHQWSAPFLTSLAFNERHRPANAVHLPSRTLWRRQLSHSSVSASSVPGRLGPNPRPSRSDRSPGVVLSSRVRVHLDHAGLGRGSALHRSTVVHPILGKDRFVLRVRGRSGRKSKRRPRGVGTSLNVRCLSSR